VILRALTSKVLPCGCLIGIYQEYGGTIVALVDYVGAECCGVAHHLNAVLNLETVFPKVSVTLDSPLSIGGDTTGRA
jgi:hypothetical protein